MTMTDTLLAALQSADMLEVDGLYAWHFTLRTDDTECQLSVEAMDGSTRRLWKFSAAEVAAASYDAASEIWTLSRCESSHRLKCFAALIADSDAADEELDEQQD